MFLFAACGVEVGTGVIFSELTRSVLLQATLEEDAKAKKKEHDNDKVEPHFPKLGLPVCYAHPCIQ